MKINRIELKNWLSHDFLDAPVTPLTLVAGPNASGKSAIADAVRFAITGITPRALAASQRKSLITDGAERGHVILRTTSDDTTGGIARNTADGKSKGELDTLGMPSQVWDCALNPNAFSALDAHGRRLVLQAAMRVDLSEVGIMAELRERKHPDALLKRLTGKDPSKWLATAKEQQSEARGGWKATTGETYGDLKAADWRAPKPATTPSDDEIREAQVEKERIEQRIQETQREIGAIDVQADMARQREGKIVALKSVAARLSAATQSADDERSLLSTYRANQAACAKSLADLEAGYAEDEMPCPHCGGFVALVKGDHGPMYLEPRFPKPVKVKPGQLDSAREMLRLADSRVAATEARVVKAEAERATCEAAAQEIKVLESYALPNCRPRSAALAALYADQTVLESAENRMGFLRAQKAAAEAAPKITETAAAFHAQVIAWGKIAEDVAPAGIPGKLLAKAMQPLNATLDWLTNQLGWQPVSVADDMAITVRGRPYALHSESMKWRADTMLALAIAMQSGIRATILDGFDVLDVAARQPAMGALYGMAKAGKMDTILLIGTMREPPRAPADVSVIWLGNKPAEQREAA